MVNILDVLAIYNETRFVEYLEDAKRGHHRVGLYIDSLGDYPLQAALDANAQRAQRVGEDQSISFVAVTLPREANNAAATRAIVDIARLYDLPVHYYWLLPQTGGIPNAAQAGNAIIPLLGAVNDGRAGRWAETDVLFIHFQESHIRHANNATLLLDLAEGLFSLGIRVGLRSDPDGFRALAQYRPRNRNMARRMEFCRVEPMGPMNGVTSARGAIDASLATLRALLPFALGGDCYWEMADWLYLPGTGNGHARMRLVFAD